VESGRDRGDRGRRRPGKRNLARLYFLEPGILNHPIAGRLTFSLESLQLPGDAGQFVLTYTPADPTTQAALETLLATEAHSPLATS